MTLFLLLIFIINPIIYKVCTAQVNAIAVGEINHAISEAFNGSVAYNDIVHFERNKNDEIIFASINTVLINKLAHSIIDITQENIQKVSKKGVDIPIGNFFGVFFLSGRGANVNVKFSPYGHTDAKYFSVFTDSGINQTLHQIKLNIVCEIAINLPLQIKHIKAVVEVLVCENFIVGKVPDYLIHFPIS